MITFLGCLGLLVAAYFTYGRYLERLCGVDAARPVPSATSFDGVDYIPMPMWRTFLIQLLNIAGLGPIFGAVLGAAYGPVAFLWITFGGIFMGAAHDFIAGIVSLRSNGASLPETVGTYLGPGIKQLMRIFSVGLMVLVGAVFLSQPASLIANRIEAPSLSGIAFGSFSWLLLIILGVILIYYIVATLLPVDKIIGRVYPFFAVLLVFMAVGLLGALAFKGYTFYSNIEWTMHSPSGLPAWPLVFITIACGACSGFHATQSPLMARCINNEKHGRKIFYGAMIAEGVIGLIWVTLGMSFYSDTAALAAALGPKGNAALVVNNISVELLGVFGGALAVLGVVVLPVTSGDTAFRAARLTIADAIGYDQRPHKNRLMIAVPLFVVGVALNFIPFGMLWRYFGFANQALAAIMLWAAAAYLLHRGKFHWIASVPACFMTAVSAVYICFEKTMGFGMSYELSNIVGIAIALICFALLLTAGRKVQPTDDLSV